MRARAENTRTSACASWWIWSASSRIISSAIRTSFPAVSANASASPAPLPGNPEFIVCDEPISALDVSIQAQVINTLESLQEKLGLSYLFVSHDLSMVRHISHNVGVMYLGCMVERAPVQELYSNMLHPYTQALMSAVPIPDPDMAAASQRIHLSGDVPTPIDPPSGCRFRARCPYATEQCAQERPELREVAPDHFVACHRIK